MQPQDPRRQPSLLSSLDGLAQPVQSQQPIQQPVQQPVQQAPQAPVVQPTATDQDANLVPDELKDELQQVEQSELLKKVKDYQTEEGRFSEYSLGDMGGQLTVHEGDKGYTIRNIDIPEEYQRQGIGSNIYRMMNQQSLANTGEPLMSTKPRELDLSSGKEQVWELSDKAKGMWNKLVEAGEAIQNPDGTYQFTKIQPEQAQQPEQPLIQEEVIQEPITEKTLLEEAKNYKNPDDYARKISDNGYLPTEVGDKLVIFKGSGAGMQFGTSNMFEYAKRWEESKKNMPEGTSSFANNYRKAAEYGEVTPYIIDKKDVMNKDDYFALLAEKLGVEPSYPGFYKGYWRRADKFPDLIPEIKDMGYKAFTDTNGEIVVLDNNAVENLWNKAQPPTLRGTKKYTEADIKDQQPDIQVAKDLVVKDTSGQTVELKEGEKLTPYVMKDGRVVIQDGVASTISPSTLDQIEKSSISSKYKNSAFSKDLSNYEFLTLKDQENSIKEYEQELRKLGITLESDESMDGSISFTYTLDEPEQLKEYRLYDEDGDIIEATFDEDEAEKWKQDLLDKGVTDVRKYVDYDYIDDPIIEEYPNAFSGTTDPENDFPDWISEQMPEQPYLNDQPRHWGYNLGDKRDYNNYREVALLTEPVWEKEKNEAADKLRKKQEKYGWDERKFQDEYDKAEDRINAKYTLQETYKNDYHFYEQLTEHGQYEAHYRMNDRTFNGGKVAFLEEAQSDFARNIRGKKGENYMETPGMFYKETMRKKKLEKKIYELDKKIDPITSSLRQLADNIVKSGGPYTYVYDDKSLKENMYGKYNKAIDSKINKIIKLREQRARLKDQRDDIKNWADNVDFSYSPTVKNWRENTVKAALVDAVESGAKYFAWTTGEQQKKRYDKKAVVDRVEKVEANLIELGGNYTGKEMEENYYLLRMYKPNDNYSTMTLLVNKKTPNLIVEDVYGGSSQLTNEFIDKPLAAIIGANEAEQINQAKYNRYLKIEDLEIEGRAFTNLYDKQLPDLVQKLTKQKVKYADMGFDDKPKYIYYKSTAYPGRLAENFDDLKPGYFITQYNESDYGYKLITKKTPRYVETINLAYLYPDLADPVDVERNINRKTGNLYTTDIKNGIEVPKSKIFQLIKDKQKREMEKAKINALVRATDSLYPEDNFIGKKAQRQKKINEYVRKEVEWMKSRPFTKMEKGEFTISKQPYIELTPIVKAIVQGKRPPISASRKKY